MPGPRTCAQVLDLRHPGNPGLRPAAGLRWETKPAPAGERSRRPLGKVAGADLDQSGEPVADGVAEELKRLVRGGRIVVHRGRTRGPWEEGPRVSTGFRHQNASRCHSRASAAVSVRAKIAIRSTAPLRRCPPPWSAAKRNGLVAHPVIPSPGTLAPPARTPST